MSFLDVNISRENGKFVTTDCRKPTVSGVYTHFKSFLSSTQKFGLVYTLVFRCYTLWSDWWKFHRELVTLKRSFPKKLLSKVIYR